MDMLGKGMIHVPNMMEQAVGDFIMLFRMVKSKTYELLISGNFYVIFSVHS